jgi:hypothetical protein
MVSLLDALLGNPSQETGCPANADRGPNRLATSRNLHLGRHAILGKSRARETMRRFSMTWD